MVLHPFLLQEKSVMDLGLGTIFAGVILVVVGVFIIIKFKKK